MRASPRVAALGLALTLVCLSAAPVAAAPRAGEPPRLGLLAVQDVVDHVADLFGDWFRSVFAPADGVGDPNG